MRKKKALALRKLLGDLEKEAVQLNITKNKSV